MNEQIEQLLDTAREIKASEIERSQIVDELKAQVETLGAAQVDAIKREQFQDEIEAMKQDLTRQMDALKEQQMNLEIKGNITMSNEITREVDYRESLLRSIQGAEMGDNILRAAGMAAGNAESAGNTIQPQFEKTVIRQAIEMSPLLSLISKYSSKSEQFRRYISVGEYTTVWGEEDTLNAGDNQYSQVGGYKVVESVCGEAKAHYFASSRILHDSDLNIISEMEAEILRAFARDIPRAMLNGTGVKQPKGLLTFRAAGEKAKADGVRAHTAVQELEVAAADLGKVAMVDALEDLIVMLNSSFHSNAKFMMHPMVYSKLLKIRDTQGRSYLRDEVAFGTGMTLLGYPVVTNSDMPWDLKAGEVAIAFGDFAEAFAMVEVEGATLIMDPYSKKPNVDFLHTQRFGSIQGNLSAIKFLTVKA